MKTLLSWLTGGRPMRVVERCRFVDRVSGHSVGLYEDRFGRLWLAEGPWARFRIAWRAREIERELS